MCVRVCFLYGGCERLMVFWGMYTVARTIVDAAREPLNMVMLFFSIYVYTCDGYERLICAVFLFYEK